MNIQVFESTVKEIKNLTEDVIFLSLTAPNDFTFKAGQFVTITIHNQDKKRMKSYSVLNPPKEQGKLDFSIKLIDQGFASEVFKKTQVNDTFEVRGPFGNFTFKDEDVDHHCFIGAGTGLAPFYSMLKEYVEKLPSKQFTLIIGFRYKKNLLFHEELLKLEQTHKNFKYIPTLSREENWDGKKGRVQQHLPENKENTLFYICGLKEMVLETKDILLSQGVDKKHIEFERYN